jgi:hypothetical protein
MNLSPNIYINRLVNNNTTKTQQQLATLIRQLKDKNYKYQEQPSKTMDWTNYDLAQTNEINDMLYLIRDIVNRATYNLNLPDISKPKGVGRPKYNPIDGTKVVLMAQYFGLSI